MSIGTKVFISWSGDYSKAVAAALRDWLPNLFDNITPFMSDADIEAGQRGLKTIEAELGNTKFGIIVVTPDNQDKPWINFEAGALSKVVDSDVEQRVVPLLVDIPSPSQITGPLAQFQAKTLDRDGVRDLVASLGSVVEVGRERVMSRFDAFWEELDKAVQSARESNESTEANSPVRRSSEDMLEEVLGHVRSISQAAAGQRIIYVRDAERSEKTRRQVERLQKWNDGVGANGILVDDLSDSVRGVIQKMAISAGVSLSGVNLRSNATGSLVELIVREDTPADALADLADRINEQFGRAVSVTYE